MQGTAGQGTPTLGGGFRVLYNSGMTDAEAEAETPADRRTVPRGVFDLTPESLGELLQARDEPDYRARQILEWVYAKGATSYEEMTSLPRRLRDRLERELPIYESTVLRRQQAKDGTTKLLLQWRDGATSECVLIPDEKRRTACISTQVGCPVGCVFCASGLDGLTRQLTGGQIVEQAMRIRESCGPEQRLSNVVFMGLGEPLANYRNTVAALRTINAAWGMGIAARKITVSTVGLPAQMRKLADERLQITLALSLHAPTDELRRKIVPMTGSADIETLVEACRYYFDRTGREVTLEYVLLAGVNDTEDHARKLAAVARRMRSNVNLLRYNPVQGLPYARPSAEAGRRFVDVLRGAGVNAHLRRSRGLDIDSACGQLRRRTASD
jgi:23S rRNA (adenine2503-C2)-methyltransferase